ncbi:MAG: STAS domain-containing protein, partial [Solirubrobacterales bacterium]
GEHDLSTAPGLRSRLEQVIADGDPVVVDLSAATFIDSSILGTLLQARCDAGEAGVGFAVAHADGGDAVGRVLDITGVRKDLPVHRSREEAQAEALGGDRGPP